MAIFLGLTCSVLGLGVSATPLKVAQSKWAPYIMDSPIGKGIAHDIVTMGLADAGYQFYYEQKPWARVLKETYYGKNDVIIAIWKNDKRKRHYYFTEPYMVNRLSVISLKGRSEFEYKDLESLSGKRIAIIDNYAYPPELLNHKHITKVASNNLETSIRLLLSHRADLLVTDEFVARWMIKEMNLPLERFKVHSIPLTITPLFAAVRKDHPIAQQIVYSLNFYFRNLPAEQVRQLQLKYGLVNSD
ncbi:substrate-binding periplasmic protein [Vibrio aquaticus]|uniref:substrate-binding periplasmic protein n=1 Tax=Vibrio aquaticus TaxID=2496559 RepID=UPI001FC98DF6|nr:transporter substrate-binding domain-containing protein [Vibrio aquaticus]